MAHSRKRNILLIILSFVLLIIAVLVGYVVWLSSHYKQIIMARLPGIIANSTDSIYHISFSDINVSFFDHQVTITDVKLWPDVEQVKRMKAARRHVPPTLSTVSIASIDASGIAWGDLLSDKSLDCKNVVVHNLKWLLLCHPDPGDSLFTRDKSKNPSINPVTVAHVKIINPNVTYHYTGTKEDFYFHMKGGNAELNDWVYNYDEHKDTSTFLYAHDGKVRFDSVIFSKPSGRYIVKKPDIDFTSTPNSVTLNLVKIKHMVDDDQQTGKEKEIYNLDFPVIELMGFNWNRLINDGELVVPRVNATEPNIDIQYIRANAPKNARIGSYPNQLLLQVGLKTDIETLNIEKGHFKYTEVTPKGDQGTIIFSNINALFSYCGFFSRPVHMLPQSADEPPGCVPCKRGRHLTGLLPRHRVVRI